VEALLALPLQTAMADLGTGLQPDFRHGVGHRGEAPHRRTVPPG
jgi:hypothetical protein